MVSSVSWPTPETTGTGNPKIARATRSSLNAQRSSMLPPPRATIARSSSAHAPRSRSALAME